MHDLLETSEEHVEELLGRWGRSGHPRPALLPMASTGAELHAEGSRIGGIDVLLVRCRDRDSALEGFDGLARDIETNNLRRMKRQIEETIEDLRGANRRLENANAELNSYAAVVSHDLRAPLTTIALRCGRAPAARRSPAIRGDERDGLAGLTVSDNGVGVAPEDRERISEPLRRGRDVHDAEGTGIGLATCHKIVRSYGGDIWVEDTQEPGTTIAFTLPSA